MRLQLVPRRLQLRRAGGNPELEISFPRSMLDEIVWERSLAVLSGFPMASRDVFWISCEFLLMSSDFSGPMDELSALQIRPQPETNLTTNADVPGRPALYPGELLLHLLRIVCTTPPM